LAVDIAEGRETVQTFAQNQGLTFPILLDGDGDTARIYEVQGIPTSLFIDRQGIIRVRHTGPLDESLINEYIDRTQ
jgi:peroxiredoxin